MPNLSTLCATWKTLVTEPLRRYFNIPPVDLTATRQLRNLPGRHNASHSHPVQQSAPGRRCHNSIPASLAPDTNYSSDDDQPIVDYREQQIRIYALSIHFKSLWTIIYNNAFQDHFNTFQNHMNFLLNQHMPKPSWALTINNTFQNLIAIIVVMCYETSVTSLYIL